MEIALSNTTILIGPNNSGKTSILKALQLALGNYAQRLSEEDFFIDLQDKRASEIIIDVRCVPVDDKGQPAKQFEEAWRQTFVGAIQRDINENHFFAFRTKAQADPIKGGFQCLRYALHKWPDFDKWKAEQIKDKDKVGRQLSGLSFVSIDPQRDIYHELQNKNSFTGRVLSEIKYDPKDISELEKQIQNLNKEAVKKSSTLFDFKQYLKNLNKLFYGKGGVEISPFPKKIRDLNKYFSIHIGDQDTGVFSVEYHGMGTRSWASILAVQAFIKLLTKKHEQECEPFFPIFSLEEPEAHLHPNAQKTLYNQIIETKGQIIISTHSPYFASASCISNIRSVVKKSKDKDKDGVTAKDISKNILPKAMAKINRHIISCRGDVLFANCWILCEGITEEHVIPAMFSLWSRNNNTLFDLNISCIGVTGKKHYSPFLQLSDNLGVSVYIISDNDQSTKQTVSAQAAQFEKKLGSKFSNLFFLSEGNNFEDELLKATSLREELVQALIQIEIDNSNTNTKYLEAKKDESRQWSDEDIKSQLSSYKNQYPAILADIIKENPNKKELTKMIPKSILSCFDKIFKEIQ